MRVGVVQFTVGEDKAANLARLGELARRAAGQGAELVACPEAAMHGFGGPGAGPTPAEAAEPLDGPFVTALVELAGDLGVVVLAGMFEVADARGVDDNRVYNTVVAVGPDGLLGSYRKTHLFDALGVQESERFRAGDGELLVLRVKEHAVGVLTCYDLRFPEVARLLTDAGATCLVAPSAWYRGEHKADIFHTLVRARAIENTVWAVAPNQAAPYVGLSLVVDPYGLVVETLGDGDEVVVTELSMERLVEVRASLPCLAHRRFRFLANSTSAFGA